jgi:hypothetical protein
LKDKRAELSGSIADLEKRIGQHRADLLHVDAVLLLFAPEIELATIPRSTESYRQQDSAGRAVFALIGSSSRTPQHWEVSIHHQRLSIEVYSPNL